MYLNCIKPIKLFILLTILFINKSIISAYQIMNFDNLLSKIKEFNIFDNDEDYKSIKYNISELSGTIPYKLYLAMEELKKNSQNNDLFLNRLILCGPPGNGKSTYARKISEEIDAILFEISGPSIVNQYQGSGPENLNKIFAEAIEEQMNSGRKVIIFIDEIDSVASTKVKRVDNKASVQSLWLNLDKIKKNSNIFVILTTNNLKDINTTLLDRFGDNIIEIPNPDINLRKEVINFYVKKFNIDISNLQFDNLIKKTDGFSIRSIEDMLRSIKRTANVENNGIPNDKIIKPIIRSIKKMQDINKLDFFSKTQKLQKWLNFINSIGGIGTVVLTILTLHNHFFSGKKDFPMQH